ncbi:MAG: OmpA family protein [Agriterribacter sp.]
MKHLFILSGIILLSFLINRTVVHYSDKATLPFEVKLPGENLLTKHNLPEIAPVYRAAKSVKKEMSASATKLVKSVKVKNVQKAAKTSTTALSRFSKEHNDNFRMLHNLIKASGNYIDMAAVQFNFNEFTTLDSASFKVVMKFADKLIFDESLKVSIAGFTDNKGSALYNEQLSWARADNVKQYLTELGVKENQIMMSANGMEDPAGNNAIAEGRAENRRVEIVLVK